MSPYEEAVRIPLVFRWPGGVMAGTKSDVLFTPMDHHPTLAALAGAAAPAGLDGMDLSAAVRDGIDNVRTPVPREMVFMANYSSHWDYFHSEWPWPEWRGVRTRQFTYIKWLSGKEELFDNLADPYQMRSLANTGTSAMKMFRDALQRFLTDAHDEFMAGPAYASWFDAERNIIRTGLGPTRTSVS